MTLPRRRFLGTLAAAPVALAFGRGREFLSGPRPQSRQPSGIDALRLRAHLEGLSVFGRPPGGAFADGVTRVAYSDADVQGRGYVLGLMKAAGLSPRIDPAGNLVGARAGVEPGLPPILLGSHIDSVPSGGNFDGSLGSLAAIEVAESLAEQRITTRHPLEVVVWVNEEGFAYGGGLDGSRAAAGELTAGELDQSWSGIRKADAIRRIGGSPDRLEEARRRAGSIHCYLELHIEQGGSLDRQNVPIGVVEGIVGIDRYEAIIRGVANHAGTTPMLERQDALIAAAQLSLAVREIVTSVPGRQVGTVGQLTVSPNVPNIIPGEVRLTIELRDLSPEKVARLADRVAARSREIAAGTRTTIEIGRTSHHEPALAHPEIQQAVEQAASGLGLASLRLPSGAGHDAQVLARVGPMGMIFVPSVGGISHSPKETTRWDDCARGASVLLQTVLAVDRMTVRS